jgi:hypothetical protein
VIQRTCGRDAAFFLLSQQTNFAETKIQISRAIVVKR